MRPVLALFLLIFAPLAQAQDVRPMGRGNTFVSAAYRQAQKEGRDWPDLAGGEDGAVVHLTADHDDADMTVASTADEARLLDAVRRAALAAGLPKTDYLKRHGTLAASVDAEFNDYLRREGRDTRFTFPLARLLEGLRAAKLPGPLRVVVEKEGRAAVLVGPKGRLELTKDRTLFSPEELAAYETLETEFHLEWWAPLAAGALLLFFVGIFGGAFAMMVRMLRIRPFIGPPPPPPTPEAVQAAYDEKARQPRWKSVLVSSPALLMMPFVAMISVKPIMVQAAAAIPRPIMKGMATPWIVPGIVLAFLPFFVAQAIRNRRFRKEMPEGPNPLAGIGPMFLGLGFMMILLTVVNVRPEILRAVPAEYRRLVIFAFPVLMVGLSVFLMWRNGRNVSRTLPADDPVSLAAHELAARAGVRVRRVVERKEGGPNAFASLFGAVGVTAKLRETLDEAEMRAVLAHEIGHLKASDPWRMLGLTLPFLTLMFGLSYWIESRTPLGEIPFVRFAIQMFFLFGLPFVAAWIFSPRRRKAEHAADRFALSQIGDVEVVARALVKIHDANLAPHRLHPRDERLASHPALERRLERLREAANAPPV